MSNPIPVRVRGWLYVAGIIVGAFIAVILPDLLTAMNASAEWTTFATRAAGALTILLSTLGRSNLSDPAAATVASTYVSISPGDPASTAKAVSDQLAKSDPSTEA